MPFGHQRLTMKRDLLSWWMRPAWLRSETARQGTLFAGPWVGEFGWELMNWQGWIRALAPRYERVVVCSRASSEALYRDVADQFLPHRIEGKADHVVCRQVRNPEEVERVNREIPADADVLRPLVYVPRSAQQFVQLGAPLDTPSCDVLIHARQKSEHAQRNWSRDHWIQLCEALQADGWRVGAVGLSGATLDVPGVEEFRDLPLERTLDVIRSARAVLGPSSGPMHLASLCGTPHLVWTNRGIYRMGITSREKYESWWNPLATPVQVIETDAFDPPPEQVLDRFRSWQGAGD
jgi:hypothetical protein